MTTEPVFIQVGDLATGFAPHSNVLETTDALVNQCYQLHFDALESVECRFISAQELIWGGHSTIQYRATNIRNGIFFIDFLHPEKASTTVSLVLDINEGGFTLVEGLLPDEQQVHLDPFTRVGKGLELTAVKADYCHGTLDKPYRQEDVPHTATDELIGLRNLYVYSETERYEHIYLNGSFYAWQCLDGVEKGLADVDRCHYIKIAAQLYLFIWREKIIPTLGVLMIDLQQMITDGKILGYSDEHFSTLSNFPVGAHAQIINRTHYPAA
ncbi:MoaF C-terminal domain-containing protein [Brenneria uluponensis]|uniref:MoaF C-terminal domain-containing protein n=1 Tax=Brenneria uluponensis TaxID=3057057 RepID=UPI0028E407B7|nr:MoaF C-terminal domain-containing protein [Brenneria ulupoensis]